MRVGLVENGVDSTRGAGKAGMRGAALPSDARRMRWIRREVGAALPLGAHGKRGKTWQHFHKSNRRSATRVSWAARPAAQTSSSRERGPAGGDPFHVLEPHPLGYRGQGVRRAHRVAERLLELLDRV